MRWSLIVLALAVGSCNSDNPGPGDDAVLVASENHDFGAVTVGAQSSPVVLRFTNTGDGESAALSVFIEGPSADELLVSSDECEGRELGPQEFCEITVALRPMFNGAKEAQVRVEGGPGVTASTTVRAMAGGSTLSATPEAVEFGDVRQSSSSPARGILIRNASPRPTGPLTVEIFGAHPSDFVVTLDACVGTSLSGGFACGISIRFQPVGSGDRTATLRVTGNDGVATSAPLRGTGGVPTFLAMTPSQHAFGVVRVGQGSTAAITVRNDGPGPSGVLVTQITGSSGHFGFESNSCAGQSIAAGASCIISVRFQPQSSGPKTAGLTVSSPFAEAVLATMTGDGAVLALAASPTSLTFGATMVETASASQSIIVTNTGTLASLPLRTSIVSFDWYYNYYDAPTPQFEIVTDTCAGTALIPGASCSISIRYRPSTRTTHLGRLMLFGDASQTPTHFVDMSGTGAGIGSTVFALNFPPTAVGATSAAISVGFFNTASAPTGALTTSLDGSAYTIVSDDCSGAVLAGGATCTVSVRFSPTGQFLHQGSITLRGTPGGSAFTALRGSGM